MERKGIMGKDKFGEVNQEISTRDVWSGAFGKEVTKGGKAFCVGDRSV